MKGSILIVDDDRAVLGLLRRFFEQRGWRVLAAGDARTGAELYDQEQPELAVIDVGLPGVSGLDLMEVLRTRDADATILILTGHADVATAVDAMRRGAENFLTKPVELSHLEAAVERALEKAVLRRRNRYLAGRGDEVMALGTSRAARELAGQIELLAGSDTTVLLQGETGTGKSWVAQRLHARSRRAAAPLVEINCAGLSATFLDSELFGHEKGAFTDARTQKRGLLEVADGGTVFLDEIGDLAAELQPKLLKVLERRRFRRLGGTRELDVDVRLVAATNRDLAEDVRSGRFREDLYYRLNVMPVRLPPLRERGRDAVAELVTDLFAELRRATATGPERVSDSALDVLVSYGWPGNIRELRNVLERGILIAGGAEELAPAHLPADLARAGGAVSETDGVDRSLAEVERGHIARVLAHHGGNRTRAARALGISRATLYEKLARYDLGSIGREG